MTNFSGIANVLKIFLSLEKTKLYFHTLKYRKICAAWYFLGSFLESMKIWPSHSEIRLPSPHTPYSKLKVTNYSLMQYNVFHILNFHVNIFLLNGLNFDKEFAWKLLHNIVASIMPYYSAFSCDVVYKNWANTFCSYIKIEIFKN